MSRAMTPSSTEVLPGTDPGPNSVPVPVPAPVPPVPAIPTQGTRGPVAAGTTWSAGALGDVAYALFALRCPAPLAELRPLADVRPEHPQARHRGAVLDESDRQAALLGEIGVLDI